MKVIKNPAVRSMVTLGLSLILLIVLWSILGYALFPSGDHADPDPYAALIEEHGPLLEQVAQNALDDTQWAGIRGLPEVRELLSACDVLDVRADDGVVRFTLPSTSPEGGLALVYAPEGMYVPRDVAEQPESWTELEPSGDTRRWTGGMMGKGYCNVRRLSDRFFLVDAYLPT